MPAATEIPGTCNICGETVQGNRIRRHLLRCIETQTGLKPSRDPGRNDRRRNALKTAYISIRSTGGPHWLELGIRCDATLHELDRFLRALWLECCGHLSHFKIHGVTYSVMVPMPGERRRFDPMDEEEAAWRHMGKSVNATIPPLSKFQHEFDYGTPTELELEHVAVFGDLVQRVTSAQPWHGGKIVVLARNNSLKSCLRCGDPAHWRAAPKYDEYEEYDDELYESEAALCADDLDTITFCGECAAEAADLVPLPNSPRVGVNCYDNVSSWGAWPLSESDECLPTVWGR